MASNKKNYSSFNNVTFIIADIIVAIIGWTLIYQFRNYLLYHEYLGDFLKIDINYWKGILVIPFFWFVLYYLFGSYSNVYYKSRLRELFDTMWQSTIGCLVVFFAIFLDDPQDNISYYYYVLIFYFLIHWSLTYISRLFLINIIKKQIHNGTIQFNTLLIGNNGFAHKFYNETKDILRLKGKIYKGYISTKFGSDSEIPSLPKIGELEDLGKVLDVHQISSIVIGIEKNERIEILRLLELLSYYDVDISIKADMIDILTGSVKVKDVHDEAFIEIDNNLMSKFQLNLKRLMDVTVASLGIIILSPLLLFIAIRVRLSSAGPIIYSQERVGRGGVTFKIYKFRSMYHPAEEDTPLLSSKNDPRITHWGNYMRKWRLDELPQLWNILKGEMSLVGPRPERQYFINLIKEINPLYLHLHKVKPGLTSWGMVKFGYAENVNEMVARMKYDLVYVENASISLDIQIIIRTFSIIFSGKGK